MAHDVTELHRRSCRFFADAVDGVHAVQWSDPTPCADWDVRTLVNHVVAEDRWTPPLLAGSTIEDVGDRFDGDVLGARPAAASRAASDEAVEAVRRGGTLDHTVHLSFADAPASEYVWQLFTDHLLHAWDLRRATGQDDRLPPDLVEACAGWFAEREDLYRSAELIGPPLPVPDFADPQTRLLAAFGRPADWPAGT